MERSRKDFVNKRQIGAFYENIACDYLEEQGIQILERNYRCKFGEIDIIGKEGNCIIFVEVKYRKSNNAGPPLMAVDYKKQVKICRCATVYCMMHPNLTHMRYDVIGITDTKIEWVRNAFVHRGYGFY